MDFSLVDVFGVEEFSGNPVAVVHDAEELSSEQMQRITRWLNLSEAGQAGLPVHYPGSQGQGRGALFQRPER